MPIDEIAAAQLGLRALGGLLSLPRAFQAQRLEDQMAREAAVQALGYTPEKAAEMYPEPGFLARTLDPGQYQNPVARGVLGTTGDLGNVINGLMGQPIRAPRVDLGAMSQVGVIRQKADELKQNEEVAKQFKNPVAAAAARQGNFEAATRIEQGQGIESSTFVNRVQKFLARGHDLNTAREMALAEEDATWRGRTAYSGQISLGNTVAGIGARAGVEQQQSERDRQRGRAFADRMLGGDNGGTVEPQGMPLPSPWQQRGGLTLIGDQGMPSRQGLVPRSLTVTEGTASGTWGRDPVQESYDQIGPKIAEQRAMIPGTVEEKEALQEIYPNDEEKAVRRDTLFKLEAVGKVEALLIPKMEASLAVLSENPLVAKFIQPSLLEWYAKGWMGPQMARAAKEIQTLKAHRASLARMVDVGNLSGTEQDVWNPYVLGMEMTVEEMQQAIEALKRDFGRMRAWNLRIANAPDRASLMQALEGRAADTAQAPKTYVPPQKTRTTTGGEDVHKMLDALGVGP